MNVSKSGTAIPRTSPLNRVIGRRRPDREKGITTLGLLILVSFVGLFAFAGLRLTPIYLNYMKVAGVLDGVYEEFDSQNASREAVRRSIVRRFEVESVSAITHREVKVTSEDDGLLVEAQYDHTTEFLSNLYFTVKFDKSVHVRR
jgi:hypothetical protein